MFHKYLLIIQQRDLLTKIDMKCRMNIFYLTFEFMVDHRKCSKVSGSWQCTLLHRSWGDRTIIISSCSLQYIVYMYLYWELHIYLHCYIFDSISNYVWLISCVIRISLIIDFDNFWFYFTYGSNVEHVFESREICKLNIDFQIDSVKCHFVHVI